MGCAISQVVGCRLHTAEPGFDPTQVQVGFKMDKWHHDMFLQEL